MVKNVVDYHLKSKQRYCGCMPLTESVGAFIELKKLYAEHITRVVFYSTGVVIKYDRDKEFRLEK